MPLNDLFQKRLIFVSGKGGVGKTTVSILLALLAAQHKKKTLLVEMNTSGRVAPVFKCDSLSHEAIALAPYISGINLNPQKCFEEYVLKQIHFKKIYDVFFNNKYVINFIRAVPGLNEILMLGKIYELEKKYKNRALGNREYDLIIVDAPATGHGLSALEVPEVVKSAVKIGPLHKRAQHILDLLGDSGKTRFCLVTLAEEMPVSESREYVCALKERTQLSFGPLFINAVMPGVQKITKINLKKLGSQGKILADYYDLALKRSQLNAFYIEEINKSFSDFNKITVPYQFEGLKELKDFDFIIKNIEGALS